MMKNLREIKLSLAPIDGDHSCSYPHSNTYDRRLHRVGLCIINVGALHRHCPNLVSFDGINVGHISHSLEFNEWEKKLKKLFHADYIRRGGDRPYRAFRSRWLTSKPSVPDIFGKKRFIAHV